MRWRRKKSIINLPKQLLFSLELVAVTFGFLISAAFLLFLPPMNQILEHGDLGEQLIESLLGYIILKWPVTMGSLVILIIFGVLMSHRLYGPMFGLQRTLENWTTGDRKGRVYFRVFDYLLPLKQTINRFLDREAEIAEKALRLCKAVEKGETPKDLAKELESLIQGNQSSPESLSETEKV